MQTADVIVIGGGIAGISLAGRLAGRARVTVLEREPVLAYHTTGRSAAMFTEAYDNERVRACTRESRPFYENPPPGFSEVPLLHPRIVLSIAQPHEEAELAERIAENPGIIAPLEPADAHALMPLLREGRFSRFSIERSSADIDVGALFDGFRRMALRGGAEIITGQEVIAIEAHASGWTVRTGGGVFSAPIVVNAAGAWGGRIGTLAGLGDKGLQPLRRTAVMIAAPEGVDVSGWPTVMATGAQFYFKPDAGQILASPEDETPADPCDAQPEEIDVATIAHRIVEATTIAVRRISRRWAGLRSFTPDRTPLFAFDDAAQGFFWLIGQGGYGMQTAPSISACVADMILARL